MQLTTITTKGQVTIPEHVRRVLGIDAGDKAVFTRIDAQKNEVVLRVISQDIVHELAGSLHSSVSQKDHKKARLQAGIALGKKYTP